MAKSTVQWYGTQVQRQALEGTKAGVDAVTAQIARVAPGFLTKGHGVDRGRLKRNIKPVKAKKKGSQVSGKVGATKRAWYGRFVASGAGKHTIKAQHGAALGGGMVGGVLAWKGYAAASELKTRKSMYVSAKTGKLVKTKGRAISWMVYARQVQHPGIQANEFMQKALDQVWPEAPGIVARAGNQKMSK